MIRLTLTLLTLLSIASCSSSSTLTYKKKAAITKDVVTTLHHYYADIKAFGLTAEFKYLDNSPGFFWTPPGVSTSLSYDSVAAILKQNAPRYLSVENTFDTLRVVPLSNKLATYTGRLHSTMTDTSGNIMRFQLLETGIVIKRKDGWKLLSGHTSMAN